MLGFNLPQIALEPALDRTCRHLTATVGNKKFNFFSNISYLLYVFRLSTSRITNIGFF